MYRYPFIVVIALFGIASSPTAWAQADEIAAFSFNKDVRPILADHCFACHGQDGAARKAGLRLDTAEGAVAPLKSGTTAIVPGNADASALIHRVLTDDIDDRMPPAEKSEALTPEQIAVLRDWINQGAPYEAHWAYIAPVKPDVPEVENTAWPRNDIDRFVLARLEADGLAPAPPADRYTLVRRLGFDVTGMPPTVEEADAFVTDERPDALEWVLDRLLASPHYGEHRARYWLDLARYADSNGYHIDAPRSMWPYRDWVIGAYNKNMPFDQFTREQLAGDLLPDPSLQQRIATGFHRNTMLNEEGGIDPEEFRTKSVVDRVDATMTTWMGTTMACAQCHDHKYDPFTQKEFYEFYAFFNTVPEIGGGTFQSRAPLVELPPNPTLQAELDGLNSVIAKLKAEMLPASEETAPAEEKAKDAPPTRLETLEKQREEKRKKIVTSLTMAEMDEPRATRILARGDFLQPGEEVLPATPAVLPALNPPAEGRLSRLDLANWMVDPSNPLTARVAVNRLWQELFGRGLVSTPEDFGTRGAAPSHPELLDYLAVTFVESGWDVKGLLRRMLSSATYQQSAAVGNEAYARDPDNVLLARGPRFRLDGEAIRDNALVVSGLINETVGGPSVHPYQPPGLWEEKALTGYGAGIWPTDSGSDLYRRAIYTYRRRSVPYPTFQAFDAPGFEYCTAERARTNTPLQALTTMNDPQFVEAARVFGERILRDGGESLEEKIAFALRHCLTRPPKAAERALLAQLYNDEHAKFSVDPNAVQHLVQQGRAPVASDLDGPALATWTTIASILLNLDETVTKG